MKPKLQLDLFDGKIQAYKQALQEILDTANKNASKFPKSMLGMGYIVGVTRAISVFDEIFTEKG
jgi:hypothetical protein